MSKLRDHCHLYEVNRVCDRDESKMLTLSFFRGDTFASLPTIIGNEEVSYRKKNCDVCEPQSTWSGSLSICRVLPISQTLSKGAQWGPPLSPKHPLCDE